MREKMRKEKGMVRVERTGKKSDETNTSRRKKDRRKKDKVKHVIENDGWMEVTSDEVV